MTRPRGEWFVHTDTADPAKTVNRSMFAYTRGAISAARWASRMAADYGAERVTISHNGKVAGEFTGAFWVHLTDPTLRRALERLEWA